MKPLRTIMRSPSRMNLSCVPLSAVNGGNRKKMNGSPRKRGEPTGGGMKPLRTISCAELVGCPSYERILNTPTAIPIEMGYN